MLPLSAVADLLDPTMPLPVIILANPANAEEWWVAVVDFARQGTKNPYLAQLIGVDPVFKYQRRWLGGTGLIQLPPGLQAKLRSSSGDKEVLGLRICIVEGSSLDAGRPLEYRGSLPAWTGSRTGHLVFYPPRTLEPIGEVTVRALLTAPQPKVALSAPIARDRRLINFEPEEDS